LSQARKGILQQLGLPHHEFWPWWVLVAPMWPIWLLYGIRLRCATWFTTVNPVIEDGGFMGESKIKIMDIIPDAYMPNTLFIPVNKALNEELIYSKMTLPCIAKPDIGGRGRKIKFIHKKQDLIDYHHEVGEDYMVQQIIDSPLELGVFYARIPNEQQGKVLSIASKVFLSVTGNGHSNIEALMKKDKRSRDQIERLSKTLDLAKVPASGEEVLLEPIGNHIKGTVFKNENHRITERLSKTFDKITSEINGFYYGRFDIRVTNWDDLEAGNNISILELNGLTSDAAHIFDPNYRLRDVFSTQYKHIKIAFAISKYNLKHGVRATPIKELFSKTKEALKDM
jgi:hypothetical protein